jgi:hypothetical protein
METEKFKLKDIGYGFVVPLLVGLLIVAFPAILRPALDSWFPAPNMMTGAAGSSYAFITVIFTQGFSLIVMFAVPVILGLVWNKWAGGAAGFLLGTLYYVAYAGYNMAENTKNFLGFVIADPSLAHSYLPNLYADPSFIGDYIVCGILVGYIAGALNNGSFNFKRMLGAGITAALTAGFLQYIFNYYISFGAWMTQGDPLYAFWTTLLPMVVLGVLTPIIAKVMSWYGLSPRGH